VKDTGRKLSARCPSGDLACLNSRTTAGVPQNSNTDTVRQVAVRTAIMQLKTWSCKAALNTRLYFYSGVFKACEYHNMYNVEWFDGNCTDNCKGCGRSDYDLIEACVWRY
jgi:hypothetical protein